VSGGRNTQQLLKKSNCATVGRSAKRKRGSAQPQEIDRPYSAFVVSDEFFSILLKLRDAGCSLLVGACVLRQENAIFSAT